MTTSPFHVRVAKVTSCPWSGLSRLPSIKRLKEQIKARKTVDPVS